MCRRKYDVIACICFHKRKYSDFCPKVTKYIDKMYKDIEDYCNMGVNMIGKWYSIPLVNRSDIIDYTG